MMSLKMGAMPLDLIYFFASLIGTDMVCALTLYLFATHNIAHK